MRKMVPSGALIDVKLTSGRVIDVHLTACVVYAGR
jgi:hypothetical protein